GAVAGWEALRSKFGRLPLAELLAPAIAYARDGFPVSDVTADHWASLADVLRSEPIAAETYLPGGQPPRPGQVFRNAALAGALQRVADHGVDGFYGGPTATAIVEASRERGGALALEDLREFEPEWVDTISTTYRGWTVHELPPTTQGLAALLMLDIMEAFPLREYGFHSAKALHTMIEAKKLAYADMIRYVGGPRFSAPAAAALLDKNAAAARARLIDPARAATRVEPSVLAGLTTSAGADTVYLCAIDREGNIASLIQSIFAGFGSAIVPPHAGFA